MSWMPHVLRNYLNKITHVTVSDIWMSHLLRDDQKRYPVSLLAMFTSQVLRVDHKRISCVIVYVNVKSHQSWPLQDTRAVYKKIDNSVLILRHVKLMGFYFPFRKESNVFFGWSRYQPNKDATLHYCAYQKFSILFSVDIPRITEKNIRFISYH